MHKKWFQHTEVMAGSKRLALTFYLYKIFGQPLLKFIAFFVSVIAYINSYDRRNSSIKYFKILSKYTLKNYPAILSSIRHFLQYADSLTDKIVSFSGNLKTDTFIFNDDNLNEINNLLSQNKSMLFLTTHIGNVEILRTLLLSANFIQPNKVIIFMEKSACEVFNKFLKNIETKVNVEIYPIEDIGPQTSISLYDIKDSAHIIFIAADRLSKGNPGKTYEINFLNKKIKLPLGVIKLAQILDFPTFFIVCAKNKNKYNIHIDKFCKKFDSKKQTLTQLQNEYGDFLQKYTLMYPFQFFHFYNIFEDN